MVCSIFIASITASGCPFFTASPAFTENDTTLPGMGAVSRPPSPAASPACASRSIDTICAAPSGVKTWSVSPSVYTTARALRSP